MPGEELTYDFGGGRGDFNLASGQAADGMLGGPAMNAYATRDQVQMTELGIQADADAAVAAYVPSIVTDQLIADSLSAPINIAETTHNRGFATPRNQPVTRSTTISVEGFSTDISDPRATLGSLYTQPGSMSSTELQVGFDAYQRRVIQGFRDDGNYPAAYEYIAEQGRSKLDHDTYYWFSQAASINAGKQTPANTFIRAGTAEGLYYDGFDASHEALQRTSDLIADTVLGDVIALGGVPQINAMIRRDISAALTVGNQTIGGWAGAFYYWDQPIGPNNETVGQLITSDPREMDKFIKVNEAASLAVQNQYGITAVKPVLSAVYGNKNMSSIIWSYLTSPAQDGSLDPSSVARRIAPAYQINVRAPK